MLNSSSEVDVLGNEDFPMLQLTFKALGDRAVLVFCSWLDCLTGGAGGDKFPDLEVTMLFCPFDFFLKDENLSVPDNEVPS